MRAVAEPLPGRPGCPRNRAAVRGPPKSRYAAERGIARRSVASAIPFCGDLRALWQAHVTADIRPGRRAWSGPHRGSLIQAIRQTGLEVVGYDPDLATASAASTAGFPVTARTPVLSTALTSSSWPCRCPRSGRALQSLAPHLTPGAVLTDVGTLKAPVIELRSAKIDPVGPVRRRAPAGRNGEHRVGSRRPAAVPGRTLVAHPGDGHRPRRRGWRSPSWYAISARQPVPATTTSRTPRWRT